MIAINDKHLSYACYGDRRISSVKNGNSSIWLDLNEMVHWEELSDLDYWNINWYTWDELGKYEPIVILEQPETVYGSIGDTLVVSVKASGYNLSYKWQYRTATGTLWNNSGAVGADTNAMSTTLTNERVGQNYRCIITDSNGFSVTSNIAVLGTYEAFFAITRHPEDAYGSIGDTVTFTVEANGTGLTYQWQYRTTVSTKWNNSTATGYNTNSMSVVITDARVGQSYRCVITDETGASVTSDIGTIRLRT